MELVLTLWHGLSELSRRRRRRYLLVLEYSPHILCALMWDFIVITCVYYVVFVILLWDRDGNKSYNPCPLKSTGRHTHLDVVWFDSNRYHIVACQKNHNIIKPALAAVPHWFKIIVTVWPALTNHLYSALHCSVCKYCDLFFRYAALGSIWSGSMLPSIGCLTNSGVSL